MKNSSEHELTRRRERLNREPTATEALVGSVAYPGSLLDTSLPLMHTTFRSQVQVTLTVVSLFLMAVTREAGW